MRRARHPVVLVSKLCASRLVRGILKSVAFEDGDANLGSYHQVRLFTLVQQMVLAAEQTDVPNRCIQT